MWRCSRSLVEFYALSVSTLTPQHLNILTSEAPSHLILASKINDHQILSKIAPCTPIFTKFEPKIGKSTAPQMDNWRPKTMRRTPESGIFRPSARPFFHQKEVELLFEYIGGPYNWLIFNILIFHRCQLSNLSKLSNSFRELVKPANKLYI